jgi:hypothetical protein
MALRRESRATEFAVLFAPVLRTLERYRCLCMDIESIIAELRSELDRINAAIHSLELMARGRYRITQGQRPTRTSNRWRPRTRRSQVTVPGEHSPGDDQYSTIAESRSSLNNWNGNNSSAEKTNDGGEAQ